MIHIVQYKSGETKKYLGHPIFSGESYKVGMQKHPPGEWVKVTIEAHGNVTGAISQGPDSLIRQLATKPWSGDLDTTDLYAVVEASGLSEPAVHRGPPSWDETSLALGEELLVEGSWTKITVFASGWEKAQEVDPDKDHPS